MHYCYLMYVWYFYFGGQRSLRGHFRFWAKKFKNYYFLNEAQQNFLIKTGTMHFCLVHAYFFVSRSKVIQGVKRSNLFFQWPKKSNILNCENKSVNVFYMDREAKVSTATSSSDLPLRGQRSKKVKMRKYFKWQK